MEGNILISLTQDQLVNLLVEAKIEAQEKFEQSSNTPVWKSKEEIRGEFNWGNDTLTKLMNEGLPYIKEGRAYIFVKTNVYEFLTKREKYGL